MAARIHISLHNLIVEIETDTAYPDQVTDMSNRCLNLFQNAVLTAKESGVDIRDMELLDDDDDDF